MVAEPRAQEPPGYALPQFRAVADAKPPQFSPETTVRLLVDADFAPYSFVSASGAPAGLSVELALAACGEALINCTIGALPYDGVLPAMLRGEGDVVVTGPRIGEAAMRDAAMTRPYFRSLGRFAAQSGSAMVAGDTLTLANKRIGVVKDTIHARWLAAYYSSSEIVAFDDESKAGDALRTGGVDAVFGDNMRMIYWVAGSASRGCCRLLGGAYSDFDHFSRNFAFLVARDRQDLRAAFDYGLDMVQKNGTAAKIFNAYVPLSPW